MMSAFPTQKSIGANKEGTWIEETPGQSGMTLRDYFAANAMQNMDWKIKPYNNLRPNAEVAYAIADAMMKAREA